MNSVCETALLHSTMVLQQILNGDDSFFELLS